MRVLSSAAQRIAPKLVEVLRAPKRLETLQRDYNQLVDSSRKERDQLAEQRDVVVNQLDLAVNQRNVALKERDQALERSKLWEEETYRTRAQLPPAAEQLVRSYEPPIIPPTLSLLCKHYDSLSPNEGDNFSRHVMSRATYEPDHFRFVEASKMEHPLVLHIKAATAFARGDLSGATGVLQHLTSGYPTDFNFLCLARTFEAMDRDDAAEKILRARLDRRDLFITMELATIFARRNNVDEANLLLNTVEDCFTEEQESLKPLQAEIDAAIAANTLEKKAKDDIYTDEFVIDSWWFYWRTYNSFNEYQHGNVALDSGIRSEVCELLRSRLSRTKTFIDFGAFCGFTIAKLAQEFPSVHFIGVDRPSVAKGLNEEWFKADNLEFYADDILPFLDRLSVGPDTVLFHSRTACFCYPAFLAKLYEQCRRLGINDIVMQEGSAAFSRSHLRFYEPGKFPAISVAGRGSTFMHDYPAILQRAGFQTCSNVPIRPKMLLDDRSGFGAHHTVMHATAI